MDLGSARQRAAALRAGSERAAYKRSVLRETPCISVGEICFTPLRELILERGTAGIFYEIVKLGGQVSDEVGRKFEKYCLGLGRALLTEAVWKPEEVYKHASRTYKTPDILLYAPGASGVALVVECKARRMSFDAKFSHDPIKGAADGFDEIAKGVFQIWRYVSHLQSNGGSFSASLCGVILTLDGWMTQSNRHEELYQRARIFAREKGIPEITEIPVAFVTIDDFQCTLTYIVDLSSFLRCVHAAATTHQGWFLLHVAEVLNLTLEKPRPFPFESELQELLPWFTPGS